MKTTLAVLFAAALVSAGPAFACDRFFIFCIGPALGDDLSPPQQPKLPSTVQALVVSRDGMGLSQAGFYNDPALAWAQRSGGQVHHVHHNSDPLVIWSDYGRAPN